MDFNIFPFSLFSTFSALVAIAAIIVIAVVGRKSNSRPDYINAIPVIEILKALVKICPVNSTTKWKLTSSEYGCSRCWMQNASLPVLDNKINLFGSAILLSSASVSICSLIADVTKWSEWNPFHSSQYVVKSFHDKQLRRDYYMEAEQVVSIIRDTNKIQPHTFMYRFHDFSESKVGWILFWDAKKCEFMFFLIQPIKNKSENPMCLLTHIIGTESEHCSSSASLVIQRLRNIQDFLSLSSLSIVPSKLILYPQSLSEEPASQAKTQVSSSSCQESYFSLSSIRARKREVRNTMFILVPFVSPTYVFWKKHVEFKLAVKNMDSAGSEKKSHLLGQTKEQTSSSKFDSHMKRPIRRTTSDVGMKSKALIDASKDSGTSDLVKSSFISYVKEMKSERSKTSKFSKQNSDTTSEDSETKNNSITLEKVNYQSKLRSLSVSNINDSKYVCELNRNQTENTGKLEDINENVEDNLVAIYEPDYKEMYNSSISDFEIVENSEFTENRIAGFITQGNYAASELQAEVLLASHFENDDAGNYQFAGDWMFHSVYKGMNVLSKTTCSQFMKICSFLCQTELSVAPQDVWKFVKNPQFRFICDESVKSVEVLEKISSSQKLIHTYHEVSGFLRKELIDFCLLQTEREELNKYYSCFYSIEFDKCPFMNSVIRGTLRPSGWIVEKIDKDANRSKVTYMMQVLVSSPDSMLVHELSNMVPQSVHNLKNYITSKPM